MDQLLAGISADITAVSILRIIAILLLFLVLIECFRSTKTLIAAQLTDARKLSENQAMLQRYLNRAHNGERLRDEGDRARTPQEPRYGKSCERYRKRLEDWLWSELDILQGVRAKLASAVRLLSYIAIFPSLVFLILLVFSDVLGVSDALFGSARVSLHAIVEYVGIVILQGLLLDIGDAIDLHSPVMDGQVQGLILLEQLIRSMLTFGVPGLYGYLQLAAFHQRNVDGFRSNVEAIISAKIEQCGDAIESQTTSLLTRLTSRLQRVFDFRVPDEREGYAARRRRALLT